MIHKWVFDETAKDFYGGVALLAIIHIAPIIIAIMVLTAMVLFLPWQVPAVFIALSPFALIWFLMRRMAG